MNNDATIEQLKEERKLSMYDLKTTAHAIISTLSVFTDFKQCDVDVQVIPIKQLNLSLVYRRFDADIVRNYTIIDYQKLIDEIDEMFEILKEVNDPQQHLYLQGVAVEMVLNEKYQAQEKNNHV